jgi:hypothetical protein
MTSRITSILVHFDFIQAIKTLLKNYYFYLVWRDKFQSIDDLMVRRVMELGREKCFSGTNGVVF